MSRPTRTRIPKANTPWLVALLLAVLLTAASTTGRAAVQPPFRCQAWLPERRERSNPTEDAWTLGTKRLLFYRLRFSDTVENEPISAADADELMKQTNRRFLEMSYGRFSLDWVITPLLQLDGTMAHYQEMGFGGVLETARKAALAAGFDPATFDLDLVHSPQIPGFPAGQANIRQRGALVHQNFAPLFVHELGHNLGLLHANAWDNSRPSITFRSTPPFPSNVLDYPPELPFDPTSLLGNGDLRSPGRSVEYGDYFDPMGGSAGDFNPSYKRRLHWLEPAQIVTAGTNGVYRVYAYDQGGTDVGRTHALRIPRLADIRGNNTAYEYWASFRTRGPQDIVIPTGLQLHWIDRYETSNSQLLDLLPATPLLMWDSGLPVGRTHSDLELAVHITPRATGTDAAGAWIDVEVSLESSTSNRPPSLSFTAPTQMLEPEEIIELAAMAEDPDGDRVSIHWNLGDGRFESGSDQILNSWAKPGQYLVQCEATDGRGGRTIRHALIRVADAKRHFIQGRVLTADGKPVPGVRVTNGRVDPAIGMLPDFVAGETDSDGIYLLSALADGEYLVGAEAYGWKIRRTGKVEPAQLTGEDLRDVDFIATALPSVTVASAGAVREGERLPIAFRRSGDLQSSLTIQFGISGTAGHGLDFSFGTPLLVVIPEGRDSATIVLEAHEDLDEDADEEVVITAFPPGQSVRSVPGPDGPQEVQFYYPGWEALPIEGGALWTQTSPAFQRGAGSRHVVRIIDTTPKGIQRVSMINQSGIALERPKTPVPIRFSRIGSTEASLEVLFQVGGTALNGIDYDAIPQQVTIPAGSEFVDLEIAPVPDGDLEGDETVELVLVPAETYRIDGNSQILLTIQEDEFRSAPNRLGFGFRRNGERFIRMEGEAGRSYILESSSDLISWTGVSTNWVDFSPIGIQVPPFVEAALFYRSRSAP